MTPRDEKSGQKDIEKRSLDKKIDQLVPYLEEDFMKFDPQMFVLEMHFWQILHKDIAKNLEKWPVVNPEAFFIKVERKERKDIYDELHFCITQKLDQEGVLVKGSGIEDMVDTALKMIEAFERMERNRREADKKEMKVVPAES